MSDVPAGGGKMCQVCWKNPGVKLVQKNARHRHWMCEGCLKRRMPSGFREKSGRRAA